MVATTELALSSGISISPPLPLSTFPAFVITFCLLPKCLVSFHICSRILSILGNMCLANNEPKFIKILAHFQWDTGYCRLTSSFYKFPSWVIIQEPLFLPSLNLPALCVVGMACTYCDILKD